MLRELRPFVVLVSLLLAPTGGCEISNFECAEGATCEVPGAQEEGLCPAFCDRLAACGRIDGNETAACRDQCRTALENDEEGTQAGCQCVLDSTCGRIDQCDGAPIPDDAGDATGSGSGSGSGSGTGSGTGSGGGSGSGGAGVGGGEPECTVDCDCSSGESCVDGVCTQEGA